MKRHLCIWLPNWPIQRHCVAAAKEACSPLAPSARRESTVAAEKSAKGQATSNLDEDAVFTSANFPAGEKAVLLDAISLDAVLLYSTDAHGIQRIVACSTAAEDEGVRVGMPLADASTLLSRQVLQIHPHDLHADRTALEELAEHCKQFTPIVALDEVEQPDCLFLDITGSAHLFGGETSLSERVTQTFAAWGFTVRLAVAHSPLAAWAAAHFQHHLQEPRHLQEPASDGVLDFPVEALRLPASTVRQFRRLGITRVKQLLELKRADLHSRFGDQVSRRLDQLTGADQDMMNSQPEPLVFVAEQTLEHPTAHRASLESLVRGLLERIAKQLAAHDRGVVQLRCRFYCHKRPTSIEIGLFQPTEDVKHLMDLVEMQFEMLALPGAVEHVDVEAVKTSPLVHRQLDLFADCTRRPQRPLAVLVDRLSSRLGQQNVVRMELQADAQPERAFTATTLAGASLAPGTSQAAGQRAAHAGPRSNDNPAAKPAANPAGDPATNPAFLPQQRPLLLHYPPQPIEVIAVAPDGPPTMLHTCDGRQRIVGCWGPEQIETGWWRGPSIQRAYYRVETEAGSRYWLFRRLQDGRWFLHGAFE